MRLNPGNCNKPKSFIELYQHLLSDKYPLKILEIGVQSGESLRMWADAFPKADVIGLDIQVKTGLLPANVRVIEGNQNETKLLQSFGRLDFVVDDGSHMTQDQQTSFETLFPLMNPGGVYVIEDLEPGRQQQFKNSPFTTVEYFKEKLSNVLVQNSMTPRFLVESIKSITFADNILVVEKL